MLPYAQRWNFLERDLILRGLGGALALGTFRAGWLELDMRSVWMREADGEYRIECGGIVGCFGEFWCGSLGVEIFSADFA